MENFPGAIPEGSGDDNETKAEKKDKKDGKELAKKASLLEMFQASQEKPEKKPNSEDKGEKTEASEDEKLEQLDTTEQKVVAEQLVDDRLEAVETELTVAPPGSDQEASAIGAATFLEKLGDKLEDGQVIDDQILDEVTAETASELGIPLEEISHQEEAVGPVAPEPETDGFEPEATDDVEEDDPATAVPAPPSPPTPPAPSASGPTPASGGSGPTFSGPFGGDGAPGATLPNLYPAGPGPNVAPSLEQSDRHSHLKYVLSGGLVGYLIGRRRGRIKTEKRLIPVQQKLEKQVQDLQQKLFVREESVRRLAVRHRAELQHQDRFEVQETVKKERAKRAETLKVYETGVHKQPERLGKFALLPGAVGERESKPEQLNERQLVEIAQTINVGSASLAEMYKSGRIELSDVREIVQQYLQGHDYEKLITKSIKPEHSEHRQVGTQLTGSEPSGAFKIEQLLPNVPGLRQPENLRFGAEKETHLVVRVGMVAGAVMVVVMLAVITVLWLLGAL